MVILGAYLSYELAARLNLDLFLGLLTTVPAMFVIGSSSSWRSSGRCAAGSERR